MVIAPNKKGPKATLKNNLSVKVGRRDSNFRLLSTS